MPKYTITIEGPERVFTIECLSRYTLDVDICEWIRSEIDPNATFGASDKPVAGPPIDKDKCPICKAGVYRWGDGACTNKNCDVYNAEWAKGFMS